MAERYGGSAAVWTEANLRVQADWDSYYADLDFDGEDGLTDVWEGELRVTRALFRLTGTPEPDLASMTVLSRELSYLAASRCNVFYPDSKPVIERLHQSGFVLGVATHVLSAKVRGMLTGGGLLSYFSGPLLCPDVTERFRKNRAFYLAARIPAEQCLVVDDSLDGIRGAKAAGMQAILMDRNHKAPKSPADYVLMGDLYGLLNYLQVDYS